MCINYLTTLKMNTLIAALVFCVTVFALPSDASKSCYTCSGLGEGNPCADPFKTDEKLVKNCTIDSACQKSVTYLNDDVATVSRFCNKVCKESENLILGTGEKTYCCNGDNCNSATRRTNHPSVFLGSLGIFILAKLMNV